MCTPSFAVPLLHSNLQQYHYPQTPRVPRKGDSYILHDLQTVFQVVASEAKDFTLHAEARPLGTIQRAELFAGARSQTQLLLDKIDEGLHNCRQPNYPRISTLSALISPTETPNTSPSGKRSSESGSSKQDKVASPAKKAKSGDEERSTRGMLICTSTGRPPMPDQKSNVNGFDLTACESFNSWVHVTPNVKWAPGQEPRIVMYASVSTLTRPVTYYASWPVQTSPSGDPPDESALQEYAPTRTVFDELDPADMIVAEQFCHILEQGARVTPTFTRLEQSRLLQDLPRRTTLAVESPYVGQVMHSWSRMFTTCFYTTIWMFAMLGTSIQVPICDCNALEPELRAASIDDALVADLRRVLVDGCPNYVNATSSKMNRRSFAKYGNHDLVYTNVEETRKAVQKDFSRSHSLVGNPLLTPFLPYTQQIPQGLYLGDNDVSGAFSPREMEFECGWYAYLFPSLVSRFSAPV
ncbi:unnamed protein product [Cylindrotheca closterium]|uniref:Uncharacterized protein n=1 Tax=Cylindrotheca closterium TaxID=2856 RepID=A0AAD2FUP4_9STRA|nr:unnamed protein product [Cylindrotheca closterium]